MSFNPQPTTTSSTCPACRRDVAFDCAEIPRRCPACESQVLRQYCDLKRIGGGAMGDVFEARDTTAGNRRVAIKIPKAHSDRAQQRSRFEREIMASSLMNHENIVRTVANGEVDGRPFLVMEYVAGKALHVVIQKEYPLAESRVAEIVRGIAAGLEHANGIGVVNRDIKPENILLTAGDIPKILDFGLALIRNFDPPGDRVTLDGTLLGTPSFISPEQIRNAHAANIQSDVYSLGCTAYCALSGVPPFRGSMIDVYKSHGEAPRPDIRDERPDVKPALAELIRRMMAVAPGDRPTPSAIMAQIDGMSAELSTVAPSPEAIKVQRSAIVSQRLGETDELDPIEGEIILDDFPDDDLSRYDDYDAPPVEGIALEDDDPVTGEAFEGDEDFPPPVAYDDDPVPARASSATNDGEGDDTCVVALPASAIVHDSADDIPDLPASAADDLPPLPGEEPAGHSAASATLPAKPVRKRHNWKVLSAVVIGSLALCAAAAAIAVIANKPPDPEAAWTAIQDDYHDRKWSRVEKGLQEFAEKFPESPHVAEVPFFVTLAQAGENVYSVNGNAEDGLTTMERLFVDYRDTPEYDAYCADLYLALSRLIERFLEQCAQSNDGGKLERARTAHSLLSTVAENMTDSWVADRTKKLKGDINQAQANLEVRVARKQCEQLLSLAVDEKTTGAKRDRIYEALKQLRSQHAALAADKELDKLLGTALESESSRVTYTPTPGSAGTAAAGAAAEDTLFVVWPHGEATAAAAGEREVFASLAQGVLYVFDAEGRHLWSRRLGIDSHRLPQIMKPSPTSPDAFIAVSTHDNALLALATRTGRELWRYQAGPRESLAAPLTISRWQPAPNKPEIVRGLLPTATGEIHVLEMIQGNRLGLFYTGFPMTLGGTFDPQSKLVYFPADSKRVFALDPSVIENPSTEKPAAKSMVFTEHASGSLRWSPVIVGQYFIMAEAYDLERTRVRVFPLNTATGFTDSRVKPLAEKTLQGWSWFDPPATPDRITIVTDEGQLGLFGLNLDNPGEALYSLIETSNKGFPQLPVEQPFRALGLRNEDHRMWVSVGGRLSMQSLDILRQKIRPIWPEDGTPSPVTGFPLHAAQWNAAGNTMLLTTMSPRGTEAAFQAVNADTGERLWQRQLGVNPAADPQLLADGSVLLIDRSGRVVRLAPAAGDEPLPQLTLDSVTPPMADGPLQVLHDTSGGAYLFIPQEGGRQFAIRNLREGLTQAPWQTIRVPAAKLRGTPAVVGEYVVVPCDDGGLHRFRIDGQPSDSLNEATFPWRKVTDIAPDDHAALYPLADDELLLIEGIRGCLLKFAEEGGVARWKQQGPDFLAEGPLALEALVTPRHIYLSDRKHLYRQPRAGFSTDPSRWELQGSVSAAPILAGDKVVVIENQRSLICFDDLPSDESTFQPRWQSKAAARYCGAPCPLGQTMLVTQENGKVELVTLTDGSSRTLQQLESGLIPSVSATGIGGQLLIPLADGTLLCRKPDNPKQPAVEENAP